MSNCVSGFLSTARIPCSALALEVWLRALVLLNILPFQQVGAPSPCFGFGNKEGVNAGVLRPSRTATLQRTTKAYPLELYL